MLAIGLHGDGAPMGKRSSAYTLQWNLVNLHGPEGTRYPFCLLEKCFLCQCGCQGTHTLDDLVDIWVWSMRALWRGEWPKGRHDGESWDEATDGERRGKRG